MHCWCHAHLPCAFIFHDTLCCFEAPLLCVVITETKDLCRDRAERFEHYPGIAPGTGRAFSVHHHGEIDAAILFQSTANLGKVPELLEGIKSTFATRFQIIGEASTSDMDGWAEQFICNGEAKVSCGACCPHLFFKWVLSHSFIWVVFPCT